MNNQKPTPGPWIKTKVEDGYWIEDNDPNAAFRRRIAIVDDGAGIESPDANADLLAASPELLAALEAALPYVRHYQVYNVEKWQNDMSKIKEAIKNAGGASC